MSLPVLCNVVDRCGGCPWLARGADAELENKLSQFRRLLAALNADDTRLDYRAAPARTGYRNRIRLRVDELGAIAFFNSEKSPDCIVLEPILRTFVSRLRDWSDANRTALSRFAHLEVRSPDCDGTVGVFLSHRANSIPDATLVAPRMAGELGPALVATDLDTVIPFQRMPSFRDTFIFVPLNGFMQINPSVNRVLIEEVIAGALASGCATFADLFGGAGNFAVPLVRAGLSGWLVESHPDSVRAAQTSAHHQNLDRLECHPGDAITAARQRLAEQGAFDLVIVDPPRAGIRDGLGVVSGLARRAIAYCSCNLLTLERDLRELLGLGWSLRRLTGFDMFPGTRHVEALAWLAPKNSGS